MRTLLLAIVVVAGLGEAARGESWVSKLGPFLHDATRIEIVRVGSVTGTQIDGNVVVVVRSATTPGAAVHLDLADLVRPKPGDEVLVICDSECPRAAAIEDHGAFTLHARELGDSAYVSPDVVERSSLTLLAVGTHAPELCIDGTITLLDDKPAPFHLVVAAATGAGAGTIESTKVAAQVDGSYTRDAIGVTIDNVELVGTRLTREHDGCFTATLTPNRPIVRTRVSLTAGRAHEAQATHLATGTIEIAKGTAVAAGVHKLLLSLDVDGQLELASDLGPGHFASLGTSKGHFAVGFTVTARGNPVFEFDFTGALPVGLDPGSALASFLAHDRNATAEVTSVTVSAPRVLRTRLGRASFHYVPER